MRRFLIVLLLVFPASAHARAGDIDRGFARRTFAVWGAGGSTTGLAMLDGLRPFLSVTAWRGVDPGPATLQLTGSGRLVSTNAITPPIDAPLLADGYALTRTKPLGPSPVQYRLQRLGEPTAHTLTIPGTEALRFGVDAKGRAVLAGNYVNGRHYDTFVARYLPDGTPDTGYGGDGRVELDGHDGLSNLLVRRNGRVAVLSQERWLTVLDGAGRPLKGFKRVPPARRRDDFAYGLAEGPGGTLLVSGAGQYGWVARLRKDGRLDRRFGQHGFTRRPHDFGSVGFGDMALDRRGRIVLGGSQLGGAGDVVLSVLVRLTPAGKFDHSFAHNGIKRFRLASLRGQGTSGSTIGDVEIDRRGRIVVAGEAFDTDFELREDVGHPYPAIARLKG